MHAKWQRGVLAALLVTVSLCTGCNLMSLPYFLLAGMDNKQDAKCKLTPVEKGHEVKVMVLATAGLEIRPEFLRVDRELSRKLCQVLEEGFKKNKEKVRVLPTSKVERYKDEHPAWHGKAPEEIGEHFGVDYVISLEINALSLYETGSSNTLFHGQCDITIDVVDVHKPSEGPIYHEEFRMEYPRTTGPLPASDSNVAQFRERFLTRVARELSWRFAAHPVEDDHRMEN